jgi:hypothetical protein
MPDGLLSLITGTALAIVALCLVLAPLVSNAAPTVDARARADNDARVADEEEQVGAVAALREIEFDRATGKLSDADYLDLKQRYTRAALDELRARDAAPSIVDVPVTSSSVPLSLDDAIEAAIARARESQPKCVVCGPRPETDAIYCSSCGRYLPGNCGRCDAPVDLVGSRFCSNCGEQLAAA